MQLCRDGNELGLVSVPTQSDPNIKGSGLFDWVWVQNFKLVTLWEGFAFYTLGTQPRPAYVLNY